MIFWPVAGPQNPKIVQNCSFTGFFACRFQQDSWLDLANSGTGSVDTTDNSTPDEALHLAVP